MKILLLALLTLFSVPAFASDVHSTYIYSNSSSSASLQGVVAGANTFQGDIVDYVGEYHTDIQNGVRGIVAKSNGVSDPSVQRTTTYAEVREKVGATGYYVLNPVHFLETRQHVVNGGLERTFSDATVAAYIQQYDPDGVSGVYFTNDISAWLPVQDGI